MRTIIPIILIIGCYLLFGCEKEQSERFKLLTTPIWVADSLIANDVDAGGPGGLLEKFRGEAKFNKDGTGYFGEYTGSWMFAGKETQIVIYSDSLALQSLTANIIELTKNSLKVTAGFPNPSGGDYRIRMTFNAK